MSRHTQDTATPITNLPVQAFHLLWIDFPDDSSSLLSKIMQSYNPNIAVTTLVWASSRSLAATWEIDVSFFSSSY